MESKSVFDVVVCGSLHLDIVVSAPALPRIDETAVGHAWQKICGGKGGNQAVQAARAGVRVAMLGRIGHDEFGETLAHHLVQAGVDTSGLVTDKERGSGMSVAILQDDGNYGAVIVSGANLAIDIRELENHWSAIGKGKVLVLQNEIPHQVNVAAAKMARASESMVVFNAAPARPHEHDLLDYVDVLIVNRIEAEAFCGKAVGNRATAKDVITSLVSARRAVIITLGGDGLVVADSFGVVTEIEAFPVHVTSTHGAGDCFIGVLSAKLAKGHSLLAAAHEANAAAAVFVSRKL